MECLIKNYKRPSRWSWQRSTKKSFLRAVQVTLFSLSLWWWLLSREIGEKPTERDNKSIVLSLNLVPSCSFDQAFFLLSMPRLILYVLKEWLLCDCVEGVKNENVSVFLAILSVFFADCDFDINEECLSFSLLAIACWHGGIIVTSWRERRRFSFSQVFCVKTRWQ